MKKIKIGVFGVGRGMDIAKNFMLLGADIAAICDSNPERLEAATKKIGPDTAVYSDFDSFLNHGLDAVVIANFFHEHAP